MGCPALGVSVAFLKQPALPGEAPQTKKNPKKKIINKTSQMNMGVIKIKSATSSLRDVCKQTNKQTNKQT
jgi:hypothetical protein